MIFLRHRSAVIAVSGALAALVSLGLAESQPVPPSFAYLYGRVLVEGENISPESQPVMAFVNGKSCGGAPSNTFVAIEGEGVPDEDVGRTVYVLDVLADGTKVYERPGCGHTGDQVILYFPVIGRMSSQRPLFQPGPQRADLELDIALQFRAGIPAIATDGTQ